MKKTLELRALVIQQPPVETFLFEGELYRGDGHLLLDQYRLDNPSKKFRIWLIDKDLRLETGKNIHQD